MSNRSPCVWPNVSFTLLKLSRSSIKNAPEQHPSSKNRFTRFSKKRRLCIPVSISVLLCAFSCSIADWVYTSCFLLVLISLNANIMFSLSDMASLHIINSNHAPSLPDFMQHSLLYNFPFVCELSASLYDAIFSLISSAVSAPNTSAISEINFSTVSI